MTPERRPHIPEYPNYLEPIPQGWKALIIGLESAKTIKPGMTIRQPRHLRQIGIGVKPNKNHIVKLVIPTSGQIITNEQLMFNQGWMFYLPL